jgi:hypothetical protein
MPRSTTNEGRCRGKMRRAYFFTALITVICMAVPAAHASDFRLLATSQGDHQWTYTLTNNSATIDVVEWTLHWNPTDWMDDINQGLANFDSSTGIVPPIPPMWYQIPAVFPWFGTGGSTGSIKHGGGALGGFTVKYGTSGNPNPILPQWFAVWHETGQGRVVSEMMPITEQIVPEPGGLLAVALGVLAFAGRLRKRAG